LMETTSRPVVCSRKSIDQRYTHIRRCLRGLVIISAVDRFNVDMPMKLSVRIGADTSGPIVAGVLDLPLPTLRVFGELLAQVGFLSGIAPPTSVIITKCLYEPIHGAFVIKAGPTAEFKGQETKTDLVRHHDK